MLVGKGADLLVHFIPTSCGGRRPILMAHLPMVFVKDQLVGGASDLKALIASGEFKRCWRRRALRPAHCWNARHPTDTACR